MSKVDLFTKGVALAILFAALVLAAAALFAAVLMLGLQLVHEEIPAVPALGFWASFGVNLVLGTIASAFKTSATVK